MKHVFTPAAERALAEAAAWQPTDSPTLDADEGSLAALLLGLLSEPECRAALELLARGVDRAAVQSQWPKLMRNDYESLPSASSESSSPGEAAGNWRRALPALDDLVGRLKERFWDYPSPLEIATEHLLLGLLTGPAAAADWLREHGVDRQQLEDGIHRRSGLRPPEGETAPAPLDFDDDLADPTPISPAISPSPSVTFDQGSPVSEAVRSRGDASPVSEARPATLGVWRAIDASSNRAREALRVVEDYVRFVLDDRFLTERLKTLRHSLTAVVKRFARPTRLLARETQADVGTTIATASEYVRSDPADACAANFTRLEEALRSLEEFGKLVDPAASVEFERLRYEVYTLERAAEILQRSLSRLADARLYVLVDGRANEREFETLVASLVSAGVHVLQLRDKNLADRELLDRAQRLRRLTAGTRTLFVMNDRP
ncbi:MAG TPA: thiamine phosphate synthase, partial [Pirellulales bacterium]